MQGRVTVSPVHDSVGEAQVLVVEQGHAGQGAAEGEGERARDLVLVQPQRPQQQHHHHEPEEHLIVSLHCLLSPCYHRVHIHMFCTFNTINITTNYYNHLSMLFQSIRPYNLHTVSIFLRVW